MVRHLLAATRRAAARRRRRGTSRSTVGPRGRTRTGGSDECSAIRPRRTGWERLGHVA